MILFLFSPEKTNKRILGEERVGLTTQTVAPWTRTSGRKQINKRIFDYFYPGPYLHIYGHIILTVTKNFCKLPELLQDSDRGNKLNLDAGEGRSNEQGGGGTKLLQYIHRSQQPRWGKHVELHPSKFRLFYFILKKNNKKLYFFYMQF